MHHHGRAVVLSAAAWGASVVLAGLTTVPAVVLLGLVLAGAFDMISGLFRGTIWHQTIPDSHRGRLAGIEMLSYTVGPLGGEARAGLVADATSVRTAIVSGGVLCVAGVAVDRGGAALVLGLRRADGRARGAGAGAARGAGGGRVMTEDRGAHSTP